MRTNLYKYYSSPKWAEKFLDGEILFRSLSYFRNFEDMVRGDKNEGISVCKPDKGLVIDNLTQRMRLSLNEYSFESNVKEDEIFAFCMSRDHSERIKSNFDARSVVEVRNVRSFCERVRRALPKSTTFYAGRVEYYDVSGSPTPRWALPKKIALAKTLEYSYQCEFRLIFSLTSALSFENVELRLVHQDEPKLGQKREFPQFQLNLENLRDICEKQDL